METAPKFSEQEKKRILQVVFVTVFLDMIGFGMVFPLMPFYVEKLHGSATTVGFIFTSFALTQLLTTPVLGRLSDKYGRRNIILLSLVGNALSMLLFALADQLWMIFASRLIAGATAGNLSACQAVIADITDREERAKGMGKLGAGIGLGMVLGPVFGGTLSHFGMWAPAAAAAVAAIVDLALAYFWMPETRAASPSPTAQSLADTAATTDLEGVPAPAPTFWQAVAEPKLLRVMALTFFTFYALSNLQVAMALLCKERLGWGEPEAGYIFALFGVTTLVVQGVFIGRMVRRAGELNLVILGAVSIFSGMSLISVATSAPGIVLGSAFFALGVAITNPCISSLASRYAPKEMQGAILGMTQSAGGLARVIGPTAGGALFHYLGSGAPFVGGAAAALVSIGIGVQLKGSEGKSEGKKEAMATDEIR